MQRFINFIFYQVWCRARKAGPYDLTLFDANPPLKQVMNAFAYGQTEAGDRFSSQVQAIYQSFSQLSRGEIAQFKRWYQGNNDLERVCANASALPLIRYQDILGKYPILGKQLALFFRGIYDNSLLGLSALKAKIGNIEDHNKKFFDVNATGKCPFCGLSDLKGIHHTRREAYDHYLPKYRYPFNSINFRNLAPACHECNSAYKLSKDPVYNHKGRRKAFFPYAMVSQPITIQMDLKRTDIQNLVPQDITLNFGPPAVKDEIDTWKEVYGIDERYKAKICGKNESFYWLNQVLQESKNYEKQPAEIMNGRAIQAQENPYAEWNFLRMPFLKACQAKGIF